MIAPAPTRFHEPAGLSLKGLAISLSALVGMMIAAHLGVASMYRDMSASRPSPGAVADLDGDSQIQGWVHPADELNAVQGAARERLSGYGWIDQPRGVIRIPIERAMQLVVDEASPHRDNPKSAAPPAASDAGCQH